ncbi:signal peptidase I [Candidatus Woesearchaeota archaeon]|nr:signal peptidase I [Candidatus Woesearchaeota archaeon]
MDWKKAKRTWKKVWYFIWEDDSWASWFVNVLLAFIIIKFVVYPVLGLVLSTSHPIVAVVSSSMEHDGSFDDWWQASAVCDAGSCTQGGYYAQINVSKDEFRTFRFRNGFNTGDIMLLYGTDPDKIDIGDVIVFAADRPDPIIHRVIKIVDNGNGRVFTTKGDHNGGSYYFEAYIPEESYIGKAAVRIPYLGYIKIGFVKLLGWVGLI